ncbi:hypothetical protein B0O80DRAFT_425264 [Mortierella sp. GBAus27b]|nr:hypothetical protein B0O80DRAFT_425264 [Mortierella sp. GBAus27b]
MIIHYWAPLGSSGKVRPFENSNVNASNHIVGCRSTVSKLKVVKGALHALDTFEGRHSASSDLQLRPLVVMADEHVSLIADERVSYHTVRCDGAVSRHALHGSSTGRSRLAMFSRHSASSDLQLRPLVVMADEHVSLIADEHVPSQDLGRSRVAMFSGHSASSGLQLRPFIVMADEHVPYHTVRRDGAISRHALHGSSTGRSRVAMFSRHSASSDLQLRPLVVMADEHVPSRDLGRSRVAMFSRHSASSGLQLRPLVVIAGEHVPSRDLGRSRVATFSGHSASSGLQLRPLVVIADEHVLSHLVMILKVDFISMHGFEVCILKRLPKTILRSSISAQPRTDR